jgi:hypothetical protein
MKTTMKRCSKLLVLLSFCAAVIYTARGAEPGTPPAPAPVDAFRAYAAGHWQISPFYAYQATELGRFNGRQAAGVAVGYLLADNIEVEVSALSYRWQRDPVIDTIDEAAVDFKGFLPLGHSGLAPFGLIGYTRDHALDQNLMNAGAGLDWRYRWFHAFVDGRYRQSFVSHGNQFLFRLGAGITF